MNIYIAELASMKQPAIRNITFTISKNVNWFLATLPNNPDAA